MIKEEACRYFQSLLPAFLLGSNLRLRLKALSVMRLFHKALGLPKTTDILKSLMLTASAFIEFTRILVSRAGGHEGAILQPSAYRVEYRGIAFFGKDKQV